MSFPIDVSNYKPVAIDPFSGGAITPEQKAQLETNIQIVRDTIVFFTAVAGPPHPWLWRSHGGCLQHRSRGAHRRQLYEG